MTAFLESPWPAIALGLLTASLLAVAWYNTRDSRLRLAILAVCGVTLLLVLVECLVVTDREAIAETLEQTAVALESNEISRVMAFLAPDADRIRADAQRYLPGVQISDANVGGDLEVTINRLINPPTARATFTGRISGANRNPAERAPYDNFVRRFTLTLRQDGHRWLITGYELGGIR